MNGQLSGILDFEWALAGDLSYDFMIADIRERMVPKSEPILGTGYQSLRPFSPEHERRVIWYRLFLQLEETGMSVWAKVSALWIPYNTYANLLC